MDSVLLLLGILFFMYFVLAVVLGIRNPQSSASIEFGALSVVSFLTAFIRQPVRALEENLEFIALLGVAFNTCWTQVMHMWNRHTVQAELKSATDDDSITGERAIDRHSELRSNIRGRGQTAQKAGQ